MKQIIIIILLFSNLLALGQEDANKYLLQAGNKFAVYFVDLNNNDARVYDMGKYLDKAGTGYSIAATDTLLRQADGSFSGKRSKIFTENSKLFLTTEFRKSKKYRLDTVKNLGIANTQLNNAYYLDHYFEMSRELNRKYPLSDHSFRNGFFSWKQMPNKDIDHLKFREAADQRLKEIKDSISGEQDSYVAITNFIIQDIKILDYNSLKDSLVKLPADYRDVRGYYGTVINVVAKQRPEYFFKLAEDFPNNRNLIFFAVKRDKETIAALKAVEGHAETKEAFFKKK